ncbi:hypothetical protein [Prosthecobacter sp.]|uniref:hypothetical protein n=1 Tax=Prosthecobacter sp. TaxID=1965333 RepID=UPI003785302F
MSSSRHFVLSFFGPVVAFGAFCGFVGLIWRWLEHHQIPPLVTMMVGGLAAAMATRWFVRNCVPVRCPFCGGKSYEIPERGNRFMCRVCGKDH